MKGRHLDTFARILLPAFTVAAAALPACTATAPECVDGTCTCEGDPPCTTCGVFACSSL